MPTIREAAEELSRRSSNDELGARFEDIDSIETGSTVKEGFLSREIETVGPGAVAGVDGGIAKKRYSAGDVVASRAVGAVFDFDQELSTSYYPSKSPEPDIQVFDSEDERSLRRNAEAKRLKTEVAVARELVSFSTVLMDGSIVPSYLKNDEVIDLYGQLFESASSGQLVGVVEDSYGKKLASILDDRLDLEVGDIRDTILMDSILEEGERSFVRRYSDSPVEHPVLKELEDRHVNSINTFYVKLSDRDLPLRIDYYGDVGEADRIAGMLDFLKASRSYTVPSPVVEADKRAKIPGKFLERLENRFSPRKMRREKRVF